MKRTPLRRKTRLRPVSRKREAIADERRALVTRLLLQYPRCQVQGCTNESQHGHEPLTRGRGGSPLDESNVLAVCAPCHRRIHDNPAWATEQGLLLPSWSR